MASPFLSEIRLLSFNFAPRGWALCNGQLLPIAQNQGLFSLLGTTYGGDGRVNFALPDLRGRVPIHTGGPYAHTLGERAGEATHTLSINELPQHTHTLNGTSAAATGGAPGINGTNVLAKSVGANIYAAATDLVAMDPRAAGPSGGSQPHLNMQPYLVLQFAIALQGIFPSQN